MTKKPNYVSRATSPTRRIDFSKLPAEQSLDKYFRKGVVKHVWHEKDRLGRLLMRVELKDGTIKYEEKE